MILTLGDSRTGLVRKVNEDAINLDVENVYILAARLPAHLLSRVLVIFWSALSPLNSLNPT